MFLKLTNFVARNIEISTFLRISVLKEIVARNMEISMFLAATKLFKRIMEISMFLAKAHQKVLELIHRTPELTKMI